MKPKFNWTGAEDLAVFITLKNRKLLGRGKKR